MKMKKSMKNVCGRECRFGVIRLKGNEELIFRFWKSLMVNQILRDHRGHVVGMMETKTSGIVDARDANGRYLGTYDPHSNITRDAQGRAIGTGNLLASLIR